MNVRDADRLPWMRAEVELLRDALQLGVPVLGVCLGAQLLATAAGAEIRRSPSPEIGWFDVARCFEGARDPIFAGLPARFLAYEWHSYAFALPAGSVELARSAACPQAFRLGETAWGVQFHPEVVPEIVREWALDYESDPDAIAMGFDPPAHIAEAAERLPAWMEIGRDLFEGFLLQQRLLRVGLRWRRRLDQLRTLHPRAVDGRVGRARASCARRPAARTARGRRRRPATRPPRRARRGPPASGRGPARRPRWRPW